ncbi:hypothetical protein [Enterococcus faecalis]|uniref:hypothetical protein n=1 Tax=Enterococcus faecalis TaxID=1351 RepID=UPI001E3134CA|nr:hypothetical protein [Enterococcus faecalis]MCD4978463.1 hypothetical protein [Enterococcus faecalis]
MFGFKDFERAKGLCSRLLKIYFSYCRELFQEKKNLSLMDVEFYLLFGSYFYQLNAESTSNELNQGMYELVFRIADSDFSNCTLAFQTMVDRILDELRNEHDSYVDHLLSDYGIDQDY